MAESSLRATIYHLLSVAMGSASPGYMGYPSLTMSGPVVGATFADWAPVCPLPLYKGKACFSELPGVCLGNPCTTARSVEKGVRQKASERGAYRERTEGCPSSILYLWLCCWFQVVPLRVVLTICLLTMNVHEGHPGWK